MNGVNTGARVAPELVTASSPHRRTHEDNDRAGMAAVPMPKWPPNHVSEVFESVAFKKSLILSAPEIYAVWTRFTDAHTALCLPRHSSSHTGVRRPFVNLDLHFAARAGDRPPWGREGQVPLEQAGAAGHDCRLLLRLWLQPLSTGGWKHATRMAGALARTVFTAVRCCWLPL